MAIAFRSPSGFMAMSVRFLSRSYGNTVARFLKNPIVLGLATLLAYGIMMVFLRAGAYLWRFLVCLDVLEDGSGRASVVISLGISASGSAGPSVCVPEWGEGLVKVTECCPDALLYSAAISMGNLRPRPSNKGEHAPCCILRSALTEIESVSLTRNWEWVRRIGTLYQAESNQCFY